MEVLCLSLFYYALLCVHSSFSIILKLVSLILLPYRSIVILTVNVKCSLAVPHSAVGLSAVCDYGIP